MWNSSWNIMGTLLHWRLVILSASDTDFISTSVPWIFLHVTGASIQRSFEFSWAGPNSGSISFDSVVKMGGQKTTISSIEGTVARTPPSNTSFAVLQHVIFPELLYFCILFSPRSPPMCWSCRLPPSQMVRFWFSQTGLSVDFSPPCSILLLPSITSSSLSVEKNCFSYSSYSMDGGWPLLQQKLALGSFESSTPCIPSSFSYFWSNPAEL